MTREQGIATMIFDALTQRRSAKAAQLGGARPSAETIARIVAAGAAAPDHGLLVPFRFVDVAMDRREALADAFVAALKEKTPNPEGGEIEKARDKALRGPLLIALIARLQPNHPKIPISDQWLSVGAAMQNMVLEAEAEGLGVALRSGFALGSESLRNAFGLDANEHLVCFLAIGENPARLPDRKKPDLKDVWGSF